MAERVWQVESEAQVSDIAELERRLSAALDRIRIGLAAQASAPKPGVSVDTADLEARVERLQVELAAEKQAVADLEARVKTLKERQESKIADLSAAAETAKSQVIALAADLQHLRETHAELRVMADRLRSAAEAGAVQPELINRAMQAELDALRAERQTDAAEIAAVLAALAPIIEEAQ